MNFFDALKLVVPIIAAAVPNGDKFVPLIAAGIAVAEASGKKPKDKKDIALKSVRLSAETSNLVAGRTVVNVDKAVAVADSTIDQVVGLVNQHLDLAEGAEVKIVDDLPKSIDLDKLFKP